MKLAAALSLCLALAALPVAAQRCSPLPELVTGLNGLGVGDFDGDGLEDIFGFGSFDGGPGRILWQSPGGPLVSGSMAGRLGVSDDFFLPPSDMDGDGDLDVVSSAGWGPKIGRNLGSRTFDLVDTLVGTMSTQKFGTVGDLDGDGLPEVVTGSSTDGQLLVLWNAGGCVLDSPQTLPTPANSGMVVADVTGDGLHDIALPAGHAISVIPNTGARTFGSPVVTPLPGTDPGRVLAIADVVGGPEADAVVGAGRTVLILQGDGSGSFVLHSEIDIGVTSNHILLKDVTADGVRDIVAGSPQEVVLLQQDGAGGYVETDRLGMPGIRDLIHLDGGEIRLVSGGGVLRPWRLELSPRFDAADLYSRATILPSSIVGTRAALADLDGDGRLDSASLGDDGLATRLGDPARGFGPETTYPLASFGTALAIGDLDGANGPDIVVSNGTTRVFWNQGGGTFVPGAGIGAFGDEAAIGDLDGNGTPDVLVAYYGRLSALLNDGSGNFSAGPVTGANALSTGLVLADLDGDGILDAAEIENGRVAPFESVRVRRGFGDGGFDGSELTVLSQRESTTLLGADLDGDGDLDLVASGDRTEILLNDGAGRLAVTANLDTRVRALGDVDGVNSADLLAEWSPLAYSHPQFLVEPWLNSGAGTFTRSAPVTVGEAPIPVAATPLASGEDVMIVALTGRGSSLSLSESCLLPSRIVRSMAMSSLSPPTPPVAQVIAPASFDDPGPDGIPGTSDDRYGPPSFAGMRLDEPLMGTGVERLVFYRISSGAVIRLSRDRDGTMRLWY